MKTIDKKILIDAIEGTDYKSIRSYSGRGMYGKQCLGVVIDRYTDPIKWAFNVASNMADSLQDEEPIQTAIYNLSCTKVLTDSMGLDTIIYFPNIEHDENQEV